MQALRDRHGIVAVQVAVDHIDYRVCPDFVDRSAYDFREAVARFGRIVCQQTRGCGEGEGVCGRGLNGYLC